VGRGFNRDIQETAEGALAPEAPFESVSLPRD
jgi:hypothetical protein